MQISFETVERVRSEILSALTSIPARLRRYLSKTSSEKCGLILGLACGCLICRVGFVGAEVGVCSSDDECTRCVGSDLGV
eukprot:2721722-Rhodomonas_salina.2